MDFSDQAGPPTAGLGMPVRFGNAVFDPGAMLLTVDGAAVPLEARPMALLSLLLARRGAVLTKYEILDALWSGRAVTDSSLTKCVGRLRAALGDESAAMIRTVHGVGYSFAGHVTERIGLPETPAGGVVAPPAMLAASAPASGLPLRWRPGALVAAVCVVLVLVLAAAFVRRHAVAPATTVANLAQARALYLKGLQDWAQRTPAQLNLAVEDFTAALRLAPDYAEAYAGLANCYNLLPEYAALPAAQAFPLARANAERAIALKPNLAAAHASRAFALFWGDWDFAAALAEYDRALTLAPDDAGVHHWYATALDNMGDHDRALIHIERALELDPTSRSIRADRGLLLFHCGRAAEAHAVLTALTASDPDFISPHNYLSYIALESGDDPTFLRESALRARQRQDQVGETIVAAAQAGFKAGGDGGMRRALLAARLAAYWAGNMSAFEVARSYAMIGDERRAISYLSLAIDRHDTSAISLLNDPVFRPFLQDAPFIALLSRLGLAR